MSKKGGSKKNFESVGYVNGGVFKKGKIVIFNSKEKVPETDFDRLKEIYGSDIKGHYVNCEDSNKVLIEYKKLLNELHDIGNIYNSHDANATKQLLTSSGEVKTHKLGTKKDSNKKEKKNKSEKKKNKLEVKDDDDVENEEVKDDDDVENEEEKEEVKKDEEKEEDEDEKEEDEKEKEENEEENEEEKDEEDVEDEKPKKKGRSKK
jgi:hypothetical protein